MFDYLNVFHLYRSLPFILVFITFKQFLFLQLTNTDYPPLTNLYGRKSVLDNPITWLFRRNQVFYSVSDMESKTCVIITDLAK